VDNFEPLSTYKEFSPEQMLARASEFAAELLRRRTTRHFSDRHVPRSIIEHVYEPRAALRAVRISNPGTSSSFLIPS